MMKYSEELQILAGELKLVEQQLEKFISKVISAENIS